MWRWATRAEGDTEFCNTFAAYDDLPDEDKAEIADLRVMRSAWNTLFYYDPEPSAKTLKQMMAIGDRELAAGLDAQVGAQVAGAGRHGAPHHRHRLRQERGTAGPAAGLGDPTAVHLPAQVDRRGSGDLGQRRDRAPGTLSDPSSGRLLQRPKLEGEEPFA